MVIGRNLILIASLVSAGACVQRSNVAAGVAPQAADIIVTGTGPAAPIASGASAEFAIKVANAGPNDAADVKIIDTIGAQSKLVSMACTAQGGAICPSDIGVSMVVPKLPNGSSLNFVVVLQLSGSATGTIVNSMVAQFDKDVDPNNNSIAVDALVR
jgi:uncharacterized repeat protein (TIGR01451 family)